MHQSTSDAEGMPDSSNGPQYQSNAADHRRNDLRQTQPKKTENNGTFRLSLQSMSCLMDVMVTISRIGASLVYLGAKDNSAILSVSGKPFIIRRVPALLRELVEVLQIEEL